jgi:hypothetical protein
MTMRLLWQRSLLLRLLKEAVVFNFTSNPSAGYNTYFCID